MSGPIDEDDDTVWAKEPDTTGLNAKIREGGNFLRLGSYDVTMK